MIIPAERLSSKPVQKWTDVDDESVTATQSSCEAKIKIFTDLSRTGYIKGRVQGLMSYLTFCIEF